MKTLYIVNPLSGGKSKDRIVRELTDGEVIFTKRAGEATDFAASTDADVVVAVGGDGTVSEVASGLIGTGKALGIIPCGSGNGLALHMGLSLKPKKALRQLREGVVQPMDYGRVNGKAFFCTTGVGLDAEVAWQFASSGKRGLWTYISLAWKIWQHFEPDTYSVIVDGEEKYHGPAVFVTVGNANQWGNQARITSLASVQDGLLDVCVVSKFRTVEIPVLATKLLDGRAHTSRRTTMLRGKSVVIRRTREGAAHYDGDPCQMGTELNVEIVPAALRIKAPLKK